jgi:hypothetical protein
MIFKEVMDLVQAQIENTNTQIAMLQKQKDQAMKNFDLRLKPLQDKLGQLQQSQVKTGAAQKGQTGVQPGTPAPMPDAQPQGNAQPGQSGQSGQAQGQSKGY